MKVKELIKILKGFDQSLPITFSDYDQADDQQIFSTPNGVEKIVTDDNQSVVVIFKSTDF